MSRKKHFVPLLVFMIFILCFCCACSINQNNTEPSESRRAVQNNSNNAEEHSGVVVKDEINRKNYIKKGSLGSATFEIDKSHTVTKEFLADGNSVTMELSDGSGIKWTLTIPGDALLYQQTFTMTALKNISGNFPGKLTGGVRFEPDGLQLIEPATLTVSGNSLTSHSIILDGNNDGSELDYAYLNESGKSGMSSCVFHFSTAFASDPQADEVHEKALNDFNEAVRAARELVGEPLEISRSPSFDYRCKSNEAIASEPVDQYIKQFKNPENEIIDRLLTAKRVLLLLGKDEKNLDCNSEIQALVERQLKKLNALIKNYQYQYDKYLYVSATILSVVHEGVILNIIDNDSVDAYLSTVGEWCKKAREYYLTELRENHDYKAYSAALILSKQAVLLNAIDNEKAIRELSDAMSFELCFESECKDDMGRYRLHGEIPLAYGQTGYILSGTGSGYYDEYESFGILETAKYTGPSTFTVNANIDLFRPCEDSIDIMIDRFGSLQESFVITTDDGDTYTNDYNNEVNWEDPTVHTDMAAVFYDNLDEKTGTFRFHLELNNMSENTVDQTAAGEDDSGKIHFKLAHKPK